jgi:hypothetical protein
MLVSKASKNNGPHNDSIAFLGAYPPYSTIQTPKEPPHDYSALMASMAVPGMHTFDNRHGRLQKGRSGAPLASESLSLLLILLFSTHGPHGLTG